MDGRGCGYGCVGMNSYGYWCRYGCEWGMGVVMLNEVSNNMLRCICVDVDVVWVLVWVCGYFGMWVRGYMGMWV